MKLPIMRKGFGVFLVFSLLIFSCSTNDQVMPDSGISYYPLKVGSYAIYAVDETTISLSANAKVSYDLKVTVTDSVVNERGEVTYFLVRDRRNTPSGNWERLDTWSTKVINNKIIQNEGNVLYVKLIFPPALNLIWDGNEYNNLPDNGQLFYDGVDTPYLISEIANPVSLNTGFEANDALTVIQNDYDDFILGVDERKEIYARDIGLIYKEVNQQQKCTDSDDACYGKVYQGFIFIQALKEHGKI